MSRLWIVLIQCHTLLLLIANATSNSSNQPTAIPSSSPTQPTGSPTGYPTLFPTDFLQTEVEYTASNYVDGAKSSLDFKLNYRVIFEKTIASFINPPFGRIHGSQTLVQTVSNVNSPFRSLVSSFVNVATTLVVRYKVTLIMEKYDYNTTNKTFELISKDLSEATLSGALQKTLNESIAMTYSSSVPGLKISNFQASYADMKVNYLKTYLPTSMPTENPEDGPRKKHSVAFSLGAIVIGGALIMLATYYLDQRAVRKSSKTHNKATRLSNVSDIENSRVIIRSAVPLIEVPEDLSNHIERFHPLSFTEAGFLPLRILKYVFFGLLKGPVWQHHRWIGPLLYQRYVPRYVRVFSIVSYSAFVLLFSLFWVRDIDNDHLVKGFQILNWEFIHTLIIAVCVCAIVSCCLHTMIEGWYNVILASYVRPAPPKREKGQNRERKVNSSATATSPSPGRRPGIAPPVVSSTPEPDTGGRLSDTRPPTLSPHRGNTSFESPTSRRISVRAAAMRGTSEKIGVSPHPIAAKRGSVSGPLNVVVGRRNNIRPVNSGNASKDSADACSFAPVPKRFTNISVPVSRSGVHNVSRLQEEIQYCRGTLMTGDTRSGTAKKVVGGRRGSNAGQTSVSSSGLLRCSQFDSIWGLTKLGRINENRPTNTLINLLLNRHRSSFQLIVADLFSVHRAIGIEFRKMHRPSVKLDPAFVEEDYMWRNRRRVIQLFQLDVLPPMDRAIVYNQIARHERLTEPVTLDKRVKIIGCLQIAVVFLVAIFVAFWYSRPVSEKRQTSVVIIFLFWLGLDVLVVSTLSTIIKHVIIPHIATDEVYRVAKWLLKTLDDLFGSIAAGADARSNTQHMSGLSKNSSAAEKQKELFMKVQSTIAGDITTSNMPSFVSLNAAHHFFLSSRIAGLFPISFPEVKAVYSFHTLWPRQNMDVLYNAKVETLQNKMTVQGSTATRMNIVHADRFQNLEGEKFENVVPPAQWMWYPKLFPYLALHYFLSWPLRMQDVCIDMFSWGFTLGLIYLHAYLYYLSPFYLIIPLPALIVLFSVCYMSGIFRDAKLLNYPRHSKEVGLWVSSSGADGNDDPVGIESLYVHDALREKKNDNDQNEDDMNDNVQKSDFFAAMAAARDIADNSDEEDEENRYVTEEEKEALKKERTTRNLETEIAARARLKKHASHASPTFGDRGQVPTMNSLRPPPLIITKSP